MARSTSDSPVLFGLVGAGGFAREVMPLVRAQLFTDSQVGTVELFFLESDPATSTVNGIPCISIDRFFEHSAQKRLFNIAVGDSQVRQRLAMEMESRGAEALSIKARSTNFDESNHADVGGIYCHLSTVTANARIGKYFHGNIYSYVAHDCVIGDFVTFAPRVSCNGNVHIGDHACIGTGAVIRQGTPDKPLVIGEGAVVGMGAVVTKDVPPHTTVVGNPARILES